NVMRGADPPSFALRGSPITSPGTWFDPQWTEAGESTPLGLPLPGCSVEVRGPQGETLTEDEIGQLFVDGIAQHRQVRWHRGVLEEVSSGEALVGEDWLAVARVWEEVLGVSPIGPRQSFFDLGGQSFQAVQVMSRLAPDVPPGVLLEHPTPALLARRLREPS